MISRCLQSTRPVVADRARVARQARGAHAAALPTQARHGPARPPSGFTVPRFPWFRKLCFQAVARAGEGSTLPGPGQVLPLATKLHSRQGASAVRSAKPPNRGRMVQTLAGSRRIVSASASAETELPPHFELEAYNVPVGGTRDSDGRGTNTAFMSTFVREAYAGVIEVHLQSAQGLRKADLIGKSDPYVKASVGDSAYSSKTKLVTLDPVWNEKCRLYVQDPDEQSLKLDVFDFDWVGSDDSLGTVFVPLSDVCNDTSKKSFELPVEDFGGGGGGGGTIKFEVQFFPFQKATGMQDQLVRQLGIKEDGVLSKITGSMFGGIAAYIEAKQAEQRRNEWEKELWAVAPAGLKCTHEVPLPQEFEKVAYVENVDTDTQCSIWRCHDRRVIVLAFRGTETVKWKDIATDANLVPSGFTEERTGGLLDQIFKGEAMDEPNVHQGFLTAFDSVRGKCLGIVDLITKQADDSEPWQVYVTGHSLGGALATLMSYTLARSTTRNINVTMYNYGSPRVGNAVFVEEYDELVPDSFRLVNKFDGVPRLPFLLNFRHVKHAVYIDQEGTIYPDVPLDVAAAPGILDKIAVDPEEARDAMETLAVLTGGDALGEHMEDCYYESLKMSFQNKEVDLDA